MRRSSPIGTSTVRCDCFQEVATVQQVSLADGLIAALERLGVEVRDGSPMVNLETIGRRVAAVRRPPERLESGHVVLAAGALSGAFGRMAVVRLPAEAGETPDVLEQFVPYRLRGILLRMP